MLEKDKDVMNGTRDQAVGALCEVVENGRKQGIFEGSRLQVGHVGHVAQGVQHRHRPVEFNVQAVVSSARYRPAEAHERLPVSLAVQGSPGTSKAAF